MTKSRIRKLRYDFGDYTIEESPLADEWGAGDPVVRDPETLVVFLHRRNYEIETTNFYHSSDSLPSHNLDDLHMDGST